MIAPLHAAGLGYPQARSYNAFNNSRLPLALLDGRGTSLARPLAASHRARRSGGTAEGTMGR